MKILFVPKIICKYKNQLEYSVEIKLISFFKKIFKNIEFEFAIGESFLKKKFDLILLCGGNSIIEKSNKQEDKFRSKLDNKVYNFFLRKKIPVVGICHGAQFIAKKYKCLILNKKGVGDHFIIFKKKFDKNFKKKYMVNSFHDMSIKCENNLLIEYAHTKDNYLEFYKVKNKEIYGIMWHPERFKKFKNIDKKIFKKICS